MGSCISKDNDAVDTTAAVMKASPESHPQVVKKQKNISNNTVQTSLDNNTANAIVEQMRRLSSTGLTIHQQDQQPRVTQARVIAESDMFPASLGSLQENVVSMHTPNGIPIEEVYTGVQDGPVLGSGISGVVRRCKHRETKIEYAVKCLDLSLVEIGEGLQQLREEISIMSQLDHPNIIRLVEVYESDTEIYLVQELADGGELFDKLDEQPDYHYSESQCANLVRQMLNAVAYLHSKGIVHRDIKLENFLFSSKDPNSELKMIDFGLSKHFKFGEVLHVAVGTPYTCAPEVIEGSYDERCDIWAIGVLTFLLLSGDAPFGGCYNESLVEVRNNILSGNYSFKPDEIWHDISEEGKDFISTLLKVNPMTRPHAKDLFGHVWFKKWMSDNGRIESKQLSKDVINSLIKFKSYPKVKQVLLEVLSFSLLPEQVADLKKEFQVFDKGTGEISLKNFKRILMERMNVNEDEIEAIFNVMRVSKLETKIHWHEFVAASVKRYDDRNIKIAFDRIDIDRKGFITIQNILDIIGVDKNRQDDEAQVLCSSLHHSDKFMRKQDSQLSCDSQISIEEFRELIVG